MFLKPTHLLDDAERKILPPLARREPGYWVKCMSVVDSEHPENREEDTGAYPNRTAYLERVEVAETVPCITSLSKS